MTDVTDPRWRVDIRIGTPEAGPDPVFPHEWTVYQGDRSTVPDAPYVLGGLTFGWDITTAYWPAQPNPMTCSLALNVPEFEFSADIVQGEPIAVTVRLYAAYLGGGSDPVDIDGPVVAEFYGRITDLSAKPRSGRHGVTLSVTAVDYTVDLSEGLNASLKVLNPFLEAIPRIAETSLANILWTNLGGTPNTIDDLWTSADHEAAKSQIPDDVSSGLEALLLSAFVYGTHTKTRMIVSPRVDGDGLLIDPSAGRMFTLDTITVPSPSASPDATLPAKWIEKDVEWQQDKAKRPGIALITATVGETEEDNLTTTLPITLDETLPSVSLTSIEVTGWTTDRHEDMAHFYLGDPANDDPWALQSVVVHPELVLDEDGDLDDDALVQLGTDLYGMFPHWGLSESTAARASGYVKRVAITGTEDTWTPYPGTTLNGIVTGVQVNIAGRTLTFDLALRRMRHTTPA